MYKKLFAVMAVACMASACGILGGPTEPGGSLASQAMPAADTAITEATPVVLDWLDPDGNEIYTGLTLEIVYLRPARNSELVAHALCDAGVSSGTIPPCFEITTLFSDDGRIASRFNCPPNGAGSPECHFHHLFVTRNRDASVRYANGAVRDGSPVTDVPRTLTWLRFLEFQPGDVLDLEFRLVSGTTMVAYARADYGLRLK